MTTKQFKSMLQTELTGTGINNAVKSVLEIDTHTIIKFEQPVDDDLLKNLNERFLHGVARFVNDAHCVAVKNANEMVKYFFNDKDFV